MKSNTASSLIPSQTVAPSQPASSSGSILTEVSAVLIFIILLILFCAWIIRRLGLVPQKKGTSALNISASINVGQRERVVIVDVDDARLVLGVTTQTITHLHTLPPKEQEANSPPPATRDFQQLVQSLISRPGKSP